MPKCAHCGNEWKEIGQPGFNSVCEKCQNYLHSCVNCKLFDIHTEKCKSSTTEEIRDKEGKNYCEEFILGDNEIKSYSQSKSEEAKKKLDQLFKI